MEIPEKYKATKPKEPLREIKPKDWEPALCEIHAIPLVADNHICCDCCCGNCGENSFKCPKCSEIYTKEFEEWFLQFGHMVIINTPEIVIQNGKVICGNPSFMQRLHNGTPIQKGSFANLNGAGFLEKAEDDGEFLIVA